MPQTAGKCKMFLTHVNGFLLLFMAAKATAKYCSYRKVALLFLTMGPMPHERLWTLWLQRANGLLPLDFVQNPVCTEDRLTQLRLQCQADAGEAGLSNPANEQYLFSIYIHSAPDYPEYPEGSIFYQRETTTRIKTEWGYHSQTVATKILLAEALKEPLNEKFVLLSETCIPIYPPETVYHVLMNEEKSRARICEKGKHRWGIDFVAGNEAVKFNASLSRKTDQWFALNRDHAAKFAFDEDLHGRFVIVCKQRAAGIRPPDYGDTHCHSPEHYLPMLLAYWRAENETVCDALTDWHSWVRSTRPGHPGEFGAADITQQLIEENSQASRWMQKRTGNKEYLSELCPRK